MPSRSITCGVCFGLLSHPVTLECHHSFCGACVRARLAENGDSGFQCPLCATPYTEVHVGTLPQYVDREAEVYVEALVKGTSDPPVCQWCETLGATVQCAECMCVYCEDCCIAVHKNSAKRDHAIGKLSESSRGFLRRCQLRGHEEYRAEFFCGDCRQICCAYCLQVGPHRGHRHVTVTVAATEVRQQMQRDIQVVSETKSRLERQAAELNRVSTLYSDTYDAVENMVTERFEAFRQQLMQRELEVRRTLTTLREGGDASLTASRRQYLERLDTLNETLLQFRSIHHGGTDVEVLERHSLLNNNLAADLPSVVGGGFKLVHLGDMTLNNLDISLDLQTVESHRRSASTANRSSMFDGPSNISADNNSLASLGGALLTTPLRLTFPVDDDVEATTLAEGVRLRCVARGGGATQIGVRSKEVFQMLLSQHPEDRGIVTWQVRLDAISDSFIGVVEKTSQAGQVPEGFYWKPSCDGIVDGQIGRYTSAVRRLPVCRTGDRVRFQYDGSKGTLRIIVNESDDRGIVVADLKPRIAACFIFYPGEALTVLF